MIADLVHKPKDNSSAMTRWMVAVVLMALAALGYSVWHVGQLRLQWFEQAAQMDHLGIDVDAVVAAKHCAARTVTYHWTWNGKAYSGSGWPCNSVCDALEPGAPVRLRFLPARPRTAQCLPTDISRLSGPPSYSPPVFLIGMLTWAILLPLYRHRRWRKGGSVVKAEH